jgi:hypothetical protein
MGVIKIIRSLNSIRNLNIKYLNENLKDGIRMNQVLEYIDIDDELVGKNELDNIVNATSLFPAKLANDFLLEKRLSSEDNKIDLSFAVHAKQEQCSVLVEDDSEVDEKLYEIDEWNNLYSFYEDWLNNINDIQDSIYITGLELDYDQITSDKPVPLIYFQPDLNQSNSFIIEQIEKIQDNPLSSEVKENLNTCLDNLPEEVDGLYVGLLLAREVEGVRLSLFKTPTSKLKDYLQTICWDGDFEKLGRNVSPFIMNSDKVNVQIDITEGIRPKLGFEFRMYNGTLVRNNYMWSDFLHVLESNNLCTTTERDKLLDCHKLYNIDAELPYELAIANRISHVKISYDETRDDLLKSKVYLQITTS